MDELRERLAEIADLDRVSMLMAWDQEVCMPPAGGEARGEMRATVGRLAHERFTDERVGALLAEAAPRDELEADIVRVARRDFDKARRVPGELVAEMARAGVAARGAWMQAREANDFALLRAVPRAQHRAAPALQRVLSRGRAPLRPVARRLRARHDAPPRCAMRSCACATASSRSSPRRPEIDDTLLRVGPFPEAGQRALLGTVLRAIGVDDEQWRLDEATHPFEATIAMTDVRMTTRYDEADMDSLYSSLHEFGHGLYEHQIDPALERTPLAGGASSAWHESQSRLWENMVGRSGGFWRWCMPHAQAALPERFAGVTWQEVQRAANAVRPSFIRVSADEVTYGLHIALRFELELALIEGDLAVADLPAAWNERMQSYLGLDVPDDVHGVLQDIHWAEGAFGYFPTYAVGNVIAGQVWARVTAELPDLDERFAAGDFAPLREWLAEHVHRFGRRHLTTEMLERVVGGGLDPAPYLAYLEAKVDASAQLMS